MSQKSGFFTSIGGDRKYSADWLAQYIAGIISNGVYTTELTVTGAGTSMSVNVSPGRAWINGYMYLSDSMLTIPVSSADGTLHRKDILVLRLDMTNRKISRELVAGNFATVPDAPVLTRTADIYELELCEISVRAGTTAISTAMITDKRTDESVCGIVCGAVTQLSTAEFMQQLEVGFNEWFSHVKGQLSADAAGRLQNQIDAIGYKKIFTAADWVAITAGSHYKIELPGALTGLTGTVVQTQWFTESAGAYNPASTWQLMECYATIDSSGNVALHSSTAFAGAALLTAK